MRCSVSQITSSAETNSALPAPTSDAAGEEFTTFTTMLLDIALRPISDAVGEIGSVVTDAVAANIARTAFEGPR